jgi:hypothetical protein
VWGTSTLTQSAAGAGSGTITATIDGDVFTAGAVTAATGFTTGNLPAGLTLTGALNTDKTVITFTLGGTATTPAAVTNLIIIFKDAAFEGASALAIDGSTKTEIAISLGGGTSTETDKTSAAFTLVAANNSVTITLTGGTYKTGAIAASDFTFAGTDATALAGGTFTRVSATVVAITGTGITGLTGTDNTVLVKGATQATAATSVAGAGVTLNDVLTSAVFAVTTNDTSVTVTLTGGVFKSAGLVIGDFTFVGTNSALIAATTVIVTRTSDTMVTITNIASMTAAGTDDDTVQVKKTALATQATSAAGASAAS